MGVDLWLCYVSGLMAAVSPCVIVLHINVTPIPLVNDAFEPPIAATKSGDLVDKLKSLVQFILGFQACYLIFAYIAAAVFSSSISDGAKLGMGGLFMTLGVLAYLDRMDPLGLPVLQHPGLLGMSYALLVTVNPCTIPFLAFVLSLNTEHSLPALVTFGCGLITPAIGFAILGRGSLALFKRHADRIHILNRVMNIVLFFSGLYVASSVWLVTSTNMWLSCPCLLINFWLLFKRELNLPWRSKRLCGVILFCLAAFVLFTFACSQPQSHNEPLHLYISSALGMTAPEVEEVDSAWLEEMNRIKRSAKEKADRKSGHVEPKESGEEIAGAPCDPKAPQVMRTADDDDNLVAPQGGCVSLDLLQPCHTCTICIRFYLLIILCACGLLFYLDHLDKVEMQLDYELSRCTTFGPELSRSTTMAPELSRVFSSSVADSRFRTFSSSVADHRFRTFSSSLADHNVLPP